MKISGIYQIQSNIKPERIYIGSAVNINNRWKRHISDLRLNRHSNKKLQRHYNKYGEVDLQFSVLSGCEKEDLIKIEQYFIDSYNPYFNCSPTAGSNLGIRYTIKQNKINSKSKKGIQAGNKHPLYGKHHTEISNQKNRESHIGKHHSIKTEFKRGETSAFKGRKHTKETKEKISYSKKGKSMPQGFGIGNKNASKKIA
jgi:group I intron endonuclease